MWMWRRRLRRRRIPARSVSNSFGWQRVRLEFMDGVRPHTDIRFEYLATEGAGMGIHLGALTTAPNCWIYRSRRRQSHLGVAF